MKKLDEKVVVPIGLAIVVVGGGAAWMTRMEVAQASQAHRLSELSAKADIMEGSLVSELRRIDSKLAEIATHLEYLKKRR